MAMVLHVVRNVGGVAVDVEVVVGDLEDGADASVVLADGEDWPEKRLGWVRQVMPWAGEPRYWVAQWGGVLRTDDGAVLADTRRDSPYRSPYRSPRMPSVADAAGWLVERWAREVLRDGVVG